MAYFKMSLVFSVFNASRSTRSRLGAAIVASVAALVSVEPAIARVDCRALQNQISRASHGPDARLAAAAAQQNAELLRTVSYAQSLGCMRRLPFLGGSSPRGCSVLNNRINGMRRNLARLRAAAGGTSRSRGVLMAQYNAYCSAPQVVRRSPPPKREVVARAPVAPQRVDPPRTTRREVVAHAPVAPQRVDPPRTGRREVAAHALAASQRIDQPRRARREVVAHAPVAPRVEPRGFFERLFGSSDYQTLPIEDPTPELEVQPRRLFVRGRQPVCVRKCDGAFFPISAPAQGDLEMMDRFCSAQCPNAETEVFMMPKSRGIENATSISGYSYTALPSALRYRQAYDPSCSCRAPGKSWAETLTNAESLLTRNQRDLIVTPEKAEELSRPKLRSTQDPNRLGNDRAKLAPPAVAPAPDGERSADLGLDGASGESADGRRAIRVIAPTL